MNRVNSLRGKESVQCQRQRVSTVSELKDQYNVREKGSIESEERGQYSVRGKESIQYHKKRINIMSEKRSQYGIRRKGVNTVSEEKGQHSVSGKGSIQRKRKGVNTVSGGNGSIQ